MTILALSACTISGTSSEKPTKVNVGLYDITEEAGSFVFLNKQGKASYRAYGPSMALLYPTESSDEEASFSDDPTFVIGENSFVVFEEPKNAGFLYKIIQVAPSLKLDTTFGTENRLHFKSNSKNKAELILTVEDMLGEFSGARSVAPTLTLQWNGRTFIPSKRNAPSEAELQDSRSQIREMLKSYDQSSEEPILLAPPELADKVLQLIYSGHADLANSFLSSCWIGTKQNEARYWQFLMKVIHNSPHYDQLVELNPSLEIKPANQL